MKFVLLSLALLLNKCSICTALQGVCIHGSCTVGREWPPSHEDPTSGTHIDLTNTAQCSGIISQFHFCSLNASLYNSPGSTVTVGLHVWRFDENFMNGVLVREYNATSGPVAKGLQCMTVDVLNEHIEIAQGDVLGVRMFERALLPLVGDHDPVFAPATLHIQPNQFSTTINRPGLSLFHRAAIFLRADVEALSTTTDNVTVDNVTEIATTATQAVSLPITTIATTPGNTTSDGPDLTKLILISVGVASGALLLAVTIICGTIIFVIWTSKRRKLYPEQLATHGGDSKAQVTAERTTEIVSNQEQEKGVYAEIDANPSQGYGLSDDSVKMTTNQVRGLRAEDEIETALNESYNRLKSDTTMNTTPNEAYGLRTDDNIKTTRNQGYGLRAERERIETLPNQAYSSQRAEAEIKMTRNKGYNMLVTNSYIS